MSNLEQEYAASEARFTSLVKDTHLSFLEVTLYRKYFIDVRTEERLRCLNAVCEALTDHRQRTLQLLKSIHEREGIMKKVAQSSDDFAAGRLTTLEVQTNVLQLLYAHQSTTLNVVEQVVKWREGLTRPYPFKWNNENYLQRVLSQCRMLDESQLKKVLPLRVAQFPLCSNITSLSLFAEQDRKHGQSKPGGGQTVDRATRLREAEAIIAEEELLQTKVMRELEAVADSGRFVPLLRLPNLVPECSTGIRISRAEWDKQLKDVIAATIADSEDSPHRDEASEAGDGDSDHDERSSQNSRRSSRSSRSRSRSRSGSPRSSRSSSRSSHHSAHSDV